MIFLMQPCLGEEGNTVVQRQCDVSWLLFQRKVMGTVALGLCKFLRLPVQILQVLLQNVVLIAVVV